jgi:Arc/MetJ-type ribon-helix-helix transcriptional regulator
MPRANVRVPTNLQEAAELLARERDYASRSESWSKARIVREALELYLPHQDDLPGEAADLLDDDLVANAGGGEVSVDIEGASDQDIEQAIEEDS